jgi:hypothetical protein
MMKHDALPSGGSVVVSKTENNATTARNRQGCPATWQETIMQPEVDLKTNNGSSIHACFGDL